MSFGVADLVERFGGRTLSGSLGGHASASPDLAALSLCHDIVFDSRSVGPGVVFAGLPGVHLDGRRFVGEAIARGAAAVLLPDEPHPCLELSASLRPFWLHTDARRIAGAAAAALHGQPSSKLDVFAVTGTNGKSTVSRMISHLLGQNGRRPAEIGTLEIRLAGQPVERARNTTPDAPTLHRLLARHLNGGGDCAVLEASSHGLDQQRLEGVDVDVAVFTNLTHDHLDYHGSLEAYRRAKQRLFERLSPDGVAVVPADDPVGESFGEVARSRGARVVTYGTGSRADLCASRVVADSGGVQLFLRGMGISTERIHLPYPGRHNVENALAACAAVLSRGADPAALQTGFASSSLPAGRLERVTPAGHPFCVRVDYAHTPDALRAAAAGVREELDALGTGRLILVFGCGGDRDRTKRAPMGKVACELADIAIVTSDNPRHEDPAAIVQDVLEGMQGCRQRPVDLVDRRTAIETALACAQPGDVVLVAGKGHEDYQIVGDRVLPFSDRDVVRELLR